MKQLRPPGVEHSEEPNFGTQMFGISGYGAEGFCRGAEENAVDRLLVLVGDRGNLFRQREDDVEVLAVEELGLAVLDPFSTGQRLTFGAVAIAAGPVANALVPARIALFSEVLRRGGLRRSGNGMREQVEWTGCRTHLAGGDPEVSGGRRQTPVTKQ
jgi:hypothetical protein